MSNPGSKNYAGMIARAALNARAIKLNPIDPFTWDSGYRMPIYNDNRMLLFSPKNRGLVTEAFLSVLDCERILCDVVAGVATGGIPFASWIAEALGKPLVYVRDTAKGHGLGKRIEGIDTHADIAEKHVVVVEDLVSTGGSSVRAVQAIRDTGARAEHCLCVFSYGFAQARDTFSRFRPPCEVRPLLTYSILIDAIREAGSMDPAQLRMLEDWVQDPFSWGERHGFPRKERT